MSPLATLLDEAARTLSSAGVRFALVGGLAVSVRTEPRFTRDIDLAVAVADDDEAESLVLTLSSRYRILSTVEHEALDRLATVRLGASGSAGEAVVDLLFASSAIEAEVVAAATDLEVFPGVSLPVARTGHLAALKLLSRSDDRPHDDIDLRALLAAASPDEIDLASEAIRLILDRGANRERDLLQVWSRVQAVWR